MKKLIVLLVAILILSLSGCDLEERLDNIADPKTPEETPAEEEDGIEEENGGDEEENDVEDEDDDSYQTVPDVELGGRYTTPEEEAYYLHLYEELPPNYLTKSEAYDKGWVPSEGNLWDVTDEKLIGGDRFYNREGRLPNASGRLYYEADVNYDGGYRGAERLVYSNDGLVYYTEDHYDSFTLMYGDE